MFRLKFDIIIKQFTAAIFVFGLFACEDVSRSQTQDAPNNPSEYMQRVVTTGSEDASHILVKFKSNVSSASRARALENAGLSATDSFSLVPGLTVAEPLPGLTVLQTLQTLTNDALIAYAEPDYILNAKQIPNDPDYFEQYGLNNDGQTGGLSGADISIESAWEIQTGNNIVVAVIDSGVDYNHNELRDNIWFNSAEIAGNNIDDDRNGYVDDVRGWNFSGNNNNPMDDNDHGTHVAGVIGAKANNSVGIAGINWNVKIMPLKFMNARGQGRTSSAINAIEYAIANGARISNNSWGGGAYSQALFDAIQAANSAGHLFVAAAGNDGANNDRNAHYPSSYNLPNIISVGASDSSDRIAGFSNFGLRSVDLLAPGVSILSSVANNSYRQSSGTSMAAPFVSGVAALLLSENSRLRAAELKAAILNNTDTINAASNTVSGGRLNALVALNSIIQVTTPDPVLPLDPTPADPIPTDPTPTDPTPTDPQPDPVTTPPSLTEVTIEPTVVEVAMGTSAKLTAIGGVPPYTWTTNNPAYGSIVSDSPTSAIFTALTVGTVMVTATDSAGLTSPNYLINLINMQIVPEPPIDLWLSDTITFAAIGGAAPYQWEISDRTVADITPTGVDQTELLVTPVTTGAFTITLTDSAQNIVTTRTMDIVLAPLVLLPEIVNLQVNETQQLTATGGTSPYAWSTSNATIADVDGGGFVTALSGGNVIITVTDFTNQTQSIQVTVGQPLNLSSPLSLAGVNQTIQMIATGGDNTYTWTSSDISVATVNASGLVTGVSSGFATITVTDGQGQSSSVFLEIRQVSLSSAVTSIVVGDPAITITATGGFGTLSWSIDNMAIATLDQTGLLTPVTAGTVTVTATDPDGFSGSIAITITDATPAPAPVTPPTTVTGGGHH